MQKINFLANGISSVGVGKERRSYLFSFIELHKQHGDSVLDVRLSVRMTFEDMEGYAYVSDSVVDLSEFKGMSEIGGGDPIYGVSKEMERIRRVLEGYQSNLTTKRMNVNVFSEADRQAEAQKIREMMEARREQRNK